MGTVIGLKYSGGVLLAADTLASYGSQARYKDVCRMKKVGDFTLLGASGEYSDFQYIGKLLDELDNEDFLYEDGCKMGPHEYSSYIGRVMYNRRSKMNGGVLLAADTLVSYGSQARYKDVCRMKKVGCAIERADWATERVSL